MSSGGRHGEVIKRGCLAERWLESLKRDCIACPVHVHDEVGRPALQHTEGAEVVWLKRGAHRAVPHKHMCRCF